MLPLALALLAIVLGGAGLYFGLTANQQLAPLTESVDEGSSFAARIDKQLSSLETRIGELSSQNTGLKETIQRLGRESSQTLRTANQAGAGVESNRDELIKLAQKMSQLTSPTPAPTRLAASASATETTTSTPSGTASTYQIKPGDTFGKIASQTGVSLNALLNANPDADPRRLRIGQEVNIPAN